jgi:hypothetical protein
MPGSLPSRDATEIKFEKGRELLQNFLSTLSKRKTYNEWLVFVEKFMLPGTSEYTEWLVRFMVAKQLDLFNTIELEDGKTFEDYLYQQFAPVAVRAFFKKIDSEINDEFVKAGIMSSDSMIVVPDALDKRPEEKNHELR